jgi:hypothetical protein
VGWTETLADLHCDGDLLLRGFQDGTTRLAILIKWTPDRATMVVRGVLEVWELVNGTPTLRETKVGIEEFLFMKEVLTSEFRKYFQHQTLTTLNL